MTFTTDQLNRLHTPMETYELTISTGNMVLNQMHILEVKRVAIECGLPALFCNTCTDEIIEFIKPIYELYKSQLI
jgi:hypothetical protein